MRESPSEQGSRRIKCAQEVKQNIPGNRSLGLQALKAGRANFWGVGRSLDQGRSTAPRRCPPKPQLLTCPDQPVARRAKGWSQPWDQSWCVGVSGGVRYQAGHRACLALRPPVLPGTAQIRGDQRAPQPSAGLSDTAGKAPKTGAEGEPRPLGMPNRGEGGALRQRRSGGYCQSIHPRLRSMCGLGTLFGRFRQTLPEKHADPLQRSRLQARRNAVNSASQSHEACALGTPCSSITALANRDSGKTP